MSIGYGESAPDGDSSRQERARFAGYAALRASPILGLRAGSARSKHRCGTWHCLCRSPPPDCAANPTWATYRPPDPAHRDTNSRRRMAASRVDWSSAAGLPRTPHGMALPAVACRRASFYKGSSPGNRERSRVDGAEHLDETNVLRPVSYLLILSMPVTEQWKLGTSLGVIRKTGPNRMLLNKLTLTDLTCTQSNQSLRIRRAKCSRSG
jgi:hypothetical protein